MKIQPLILIVDDESTVREVVRKYLEVEGFRVLDAETGAQALTFVRDHMPNLVILDVMLPGIDGFTLSQSIRELMSDVSSQSDTEVPIMFLTARTSELDRIAGFELGADDYIVKPFSPRELVARVKAVMRRSGTIKNNGDEKPMHLGTLHIDPRSREVHMNNALVVLTAKEFDLLLFFARHPRQVFTREQLLNQVWGYEFYGDESTVTVHIRRIREKVENDPSEPTILQTVWGVGYKFEPSVT